MTLPEARSKKAAPTGAAAREGMAKGPDGKAADAAAKMQPTIAELRATVKQLDVDRALAESRLEQALGASKGKKGPVEMAKPPASEAKKGPVEEQEKPTVQTKAGSLTRLQQMILLSTIAAAAAVYWANPDRCQEVATLAKPYLSVVVGVLMLFFGSRFVLLVSAVRVFQHDGYPLIEKGYAKVMEAVLKAEEELLKEYTELKEALSKFDTSNPMESIRALLGIAAEVPLALMASVNPDEVVDVAKGVKTGLVAVMFTIGGESAASLAIAHDLGHELTEKITKLTSAPIKQLTEAAEAMKVGSGDAVKEYVSNGLHLAILGFVLACFHSKPVFALFFEALQPAIQGADILIEAALGEEQVTADKEAALALLGTGLQVGLRKTLPRLPIARHLGVMQDLFRAYIAP